MIDFPSCDILAGDGLSVAGGQFAELRRQANSFRGRERYHSFRHADDPSVLALEAVRRAIDAAGWNNHSFADWGVVASGRSLGRLRFARDVDRDRGERATSPMMIPPHSLHSMAGTLSIALGMHGPQFGVSGHREHLSECLLAGLGVIDSENVEGMWVVASEIDPEPMVDETGAFTNEVTGHAVALALSRREGSIEMTLEPGTPTSNRLADLVGWLQSSRAEPWRLGVAGVGFLELRAAAATPLRKAS